MDQLAPDFWNLRGHYHIAGLVDVGTQMSLVRLRNGRFVLLDSYASDPDGLRTVEALTDGGHALDAILNVHPFHTLHVAALHRHFPDARLIGTQRHHRRFPDLPWFGPPIEEYAAQQPFADDFDFSVPAGVDFVCPDERVHVASVLVRHRHNRIVHVDDTLNAFRLPRLMRPIAPSPRLRFHPMLGKALQKRTGATADFERWARALAADWGDTRIVCAAHSTVHRLGAAEFEGEVRAALAAAGRTLTRHRRRFG